MPWRMLTTRTALLLLVTIITLAAVAKTQALPQLEIVGGDLTSLEESGNRFRFTLCDLIVKNDSGGGDYPVGNAGTRERLDLYLKNLISPSDLQGSLTVLQGIDDSGNSTYTLIDFSLLTANYTIDDDCIQVEGAREGTPVLEDTTIDDVVGTEAVVSIYTKPSQYNLRRTPVPWSTTGEFYIRYYNAFNIDLCLEESSTFVLVVRNCNGNARQKFTMNADGELLSAATRRCVTPKCSNNGASCPIVTGSCGNDNQRWTWVANNLVLPYAYVDDYVSWSFPCIARSGGYGAIFLRDCDGILGTPRWALAATGRGAFEIRYTQTGVYCVTDNLATGKLTANSCRGTLSQRFRINDQGQVVNVASGKCITAVCLDYEECSIISAECGTELNQEWMWAGSQLMLSSGGCLNFVPEDSNDLAFASECDEDGVAYWSIVTSDLPTQGSGVSILKTTPITADIGGNYNGFITLLCAEGSYVVGFRGSYSTFLVNIGIVCSDGTETDTVGGNRDEDFRVFTPDVIPPYFTTIRFQQRNKTPLVNLVQFFGDNGGTSLGSVGSRAGSSRIQQLDCGPDSSWIVGLRVSGQNFYVDGLGAVCAKEFGRGQTVAGTLQASTVLWSTSVILGGYSGDLICDGGNFVRGIAGYATDDQISSISVECNNGQIFGLYGVAYGTDFRVDSAVGFNQVQVYKLGDTTDVVGLKVYSYRQLFLTAGYIWNSFFVQNLQCANGERILGLKVSAVPD